MLTTKKRRKKLGMCRKPLRNLPCLTETWLIFHEQSQMFLLGRSPDIHFKIHFLNIWLAILAGKHVAGHKLGTCIWRCGLQLFQIC